MNKLFFVMIGLAFTPMAFADPLCGTVSTVETGMVCGGQGGCHRFFDTVFTLEDGREYNVVTDYTLGYEKFTAAREVLFAMNSKKGEQICLVAERVNEPVSPRRGSIVPASIFTP